MSGKGGKSVMKAADAAPATDPAATADEKKEDGRKLTSGFMITSRSQRRSMFQQGSQEEENQVRRTRRQ